MSFPATTVQKKKSNVFKLPESYNSPDRRKKSPVKTKGEFLEITTAIKSTPTTEDVKYQQITLERKFEKTAEMLDESYKSRKELQLSIEETTTQLSDMIKTQEELIQKHLEKKHNLSDMCKNLELQLATEKTKTSSFAMKIQELESSIDGWKSVEKQLKNAENWANELKSQSDQHLEQQNKLIEKMKKSTQEFKERCDDYQDKLDSLVNEKIHLLKTNENLVKENHSLKKENDVLSSELLKCKAKLAQFEAEAIQTAIIKRKESELADKLKSSENYIASLKDEITRININYKENIAKANSSKSQLILENRETLSKLVVSEKNLAEKGAAAERLAQENYKLMAEIACMEQHLCVKEDSNQIIDDLTRNLKISRKDNKEITKKLNEQNEILNGKNKAVEDLENSLKEKSEEVEVLMSAVMKLQKNREIYVPIANDPIDSALADYINTLDDPLNVPFTREEEGIYLFGTKRVFVKLEQGKIIIRVGGGFMQVNEFIEVYTNAEVEKFARQQSDRAQKIRMNLFGKLGEESPGKFNTCYGIHRKSSTGRASSSPSHNNFFKEAN